MNNIEWKRRLAERSDITTYVSHLTKPTNEIEMLDVLFKIIKDKKLIGSTTETGFIVGNRRAVCFQESPLYSLAQNVYYEEKFSDKDESYKKKYYGCGLMFLKKTVFDSGGRPVIYDKTIIAKKYLPDEEWWRIVNYDLSDNEKIIDWTHEREWRVPDDFKFDTKQTILLLPTSRSIEIFREKYHLEYETDPADDFKAIIPLSEIFF